jgi:hypothetical protein
MRFEASAASNEGCPRAPPRLSPLRAHIEEAADRWHQNNVSSFSHISTSVPYQMFCICAVVSRCPIPRTTHFPDFYWRQATPVYTTVVGGGLRQGQPKASAGAHTASNSWAPPRTLRRALRPGRRTAPHPQDQATLRTRPPLPVQPLAVTAPTCFINIPNLYMKCIDATTHSWAQPCRAPASPPPCRGRPWRTGCFATRATPSCRPCPRCCGVEVGWVGLGWVGLGWVGLGGSG